jgi:molybdopterin-guanine dinucleotide biosynthesis protein A
MSTLATTFLEKVNPLGTAVIGLVLAGGQSTRMGQDKSQLCLSSNNSSLLEHAKVVLSDVCNGQIIVSGAAPEQVPDVYPACGPLGGIHAGFIYALDNGTTKVTPAIKGQGSALLVIPVDMPNLTFNTLALLGQTAQKHGGIWHFEGFNLPLYVPLEVNILQYLSDVLSEGVCLSIYKMLKVNGAHALAIPKTISLDEFVNVNSPSDWQTFNNKN